MFFIFLTAFIVVPVLEILILIRLGQIFGLWTTILIVIGTGIAGAYLAKLQGFLILRRIGQEIAQGRIPGAAMLDGLILFAGGILLITPGVITDMAGLLLLFPPTRVIVRAWLVKKLKKWLLEGRVFIWRR